MREHSPMDDDKENEWLALCEERSKFSELIRRKFRIYRHVSRAILPALLGELWIILWLLIKGAKIQPLDASTP